MNILTKVTSKVTCHIKTSISWKIVKMQRLGLASWHSRSMRCCIVLDFFKMQITALLPFHNKIGGFSKNFKFHCCICNWNITETLLHCGFSPKFPLVKKKLALQNFMKKFKIKHSFSFFAPFLKDFSMQMDTPTLLSSFALWLDVKTWCAPYTYNVLSYISLVHGWFSYVYYHYPTNLTNVGTN